MTQAEKIDLLADMFEVEASDITPGKQLDELNWDSLAMITLIALVNEHFDRRLTGAEIKGFKTIDDILNVME